MTHSNRRIIVTGANGFIGSRIVDRLVDAGDSVIAFVRDVERSRERLPSSVKLVRWAHDDANGDWTNSIDGAHAIINLAGASIGQRWTDEHKRRIRESRVLGTRHIVDAVKSAANPPGVLVNASAVGYYGGNPPGKIAESSRAGDDFLAKVCVEWEAEALRAREFGCRVALVRSGVVMDPKEGALPRMLLPFRMFVGGPMGSGDQPMPWIHVEDDVDVFVWAMNNEAVSGPVNATAPDVRTNRDFARALGAALNRPSLLPAPAFALKMLLGEGDVIVTGGQWAIPERTERLGFRFKHPRLEEALTSLLNK